MEHNCDANSNAAYTTCWIAFLFSASGVCPEPWILAECEFSGAVGNSQNEAAWRAQASNCERVGLLVASSGNEERSWTGSDSDDNSEDDVDDDDEDEGDDGCDDEIEDWEDIDDCAEADSIDIERDNKSSSLMIDRSDEPEPNEEFEECVDDAVDFSLSDPNSAMVSPANGSAKLGFCRLNDETQACRAQRISRSDVSGRRRKFRRANSNQSRGCFGSCCMQASSWFRTVSKCDEDDDDEDKAISPGKHAK